MTVLVYLGDKEIEANQANQVKIMCGTTFWILNLIYV
jgi:hypothetical protein